jgi:SSS family solute:Na+ symporter
MPSRVFRLERLGLTRAFALRQVSPGRIGEPSHIRKAESDQHYVRIGRWCTILGAVLSIGTAYFVTSFKSIRDYMQALVGFCISPLFGTVVSGMMWKRATPKGGFWGLLAGAGSSVST